ncbi:MlaD family protein [Tahibacter soli]|uniref:MlaD family protein n=1 Tax=Tahibacter soli TaxID=2983605 RepID=A0A9X3YI99_9GAMM|nr:MlaD family protein [Tahibacter soli]MDC8011680.1 MlaD family protein [Tahibacter soli]
METRASYVLIGAFTLTVFIAALLFVMWIGKLSLDREWDYYDIVFKEAVTGLTVGGAVQYNGIQVGDVRKLSLANDDPRQVVIRVRLFGGTPVKTDTKASLNLVGLTGVTVIQLSGGSPAAPRLTAAAGDEYPRIVADASALQTLLASGQDVAVNANDVLARVGTLLSDENMSHVARSLEHIDQVTGAVADQRAELKAAIATLATTSARLEDTLARVDALAASARTLVDREGRLTLASARAWLDSVRRTTDTANAVLDENRAAIAGFGRDGLSQISPAVAELRSTLRSIRAVAARLRENPAAYLLGQEPVKEFEPR